MTEQRPLLLVLLAFAVSLAALGVAAAAAAARCDTEGDCSYELALAVFAFGPASLIAILVVFLMRMRAEIRWLRTLLLAGGVAVATIPLAAFLLRDVWMFPAFAALLAALIVLALWGEREAVSAERWEAPAATPRAEEETPAPGPTFEDKRPFAATPRPAGTLAFLGQLALMNREIIRLCEALPRDRSASL